MAFYLWLYLSDLQGHISPLPSSLHVVHSVVLKRWAEKKYVIVIIWIIHVNIYDSGVWMLLPCLDCYILSANYKFRCFSTSVNAFLYFITKTIKYVIVITWIIHVNIRFRCFNIVVWPRLLHCVCCKQLDSSTMFCSDNVLNLTPFFAVPSGGFCFLTGTRRDWLISL